MNIESYGTRAKGTDEVVYRVLQSKDQQTLPIIRYFLSLALPGASDESLDERAANLFTRIEKYGASAVPRNELDLVSWSDLAVGDSSVIEKKRAKGRKCKVCSKRFQAKRSDKVTCSSKCRTRLARTVTLSENAPSSVLETKIVTDVKISNTPVSDPVG